MPKLSSHSTKASTTEGIVPEEILCYGPENPGDGWEDHPWHPFNEKGRLAVAGLALVSLGVLLLTR